MLFYLQASYGSRGNADSVHRGGPCDVMPSMAISIKYAHPK
jgi:hypothetical protein